MSAKPQTDLHIEDVEKVVQPHSHDVDRNSTLVNEAMAGNEKEHAMSITQAFRTYPKAIAWSILLSTAIIMEGYDTCLVSSFYAYPQFNKKYGHLVRKAGKDDTYSISSSWQAGLSNGVAVGEILGLFVSGIVAEKIGYRKTMMLALAMITCLIFIPFFAPNIKVLLLGEILMGIPWGVFQTLTTTYAADVCPSQLRAYLTTYVNLCWVIGQFIASGVLRGLLNNTTEWAYRIPFALQWVWPVPILIGCFFAPESPWWCVRQGKIEEAKKSLRRLTSRDDETFNPDEAVAMMIHTNELEKEIILGTSYFDCFKGIDLRRTEITCAVWAIQNLCGSAFMGYSTYFYLQAGLAQDDAFDLSMAQYALGAIGTIGSWFLMGKLGRRSIYTYGLAILTGLLLIIGFCGIISSGNKAAQWAIGSMLLVYTFIYDLSVGPVCYSLVAEISSTRLRGKTIVMSRNVYNVFGIVNNVITPYMLNPESWNWGAKSGFFWAGLCALCTIYCFFRLPEPKGRTFAEMDILFEQHVGARQFSKTVVEQFAHVNEVASYEMKQEISY